MQEMVNVTLRGSQRLSSLKSDEEVGAIKTVKFQFNLSLNGK